jgi:hypothetical protein
LKKAAAIMETASKTPEVRDISFVPQNNNNNNNNISLLGVWADGLNFEAYNKMLQSPYLGNGDRIVTLDKNGIKKPIPTLSKHPPHSIKQCNNHHLHALKALRIP